MFLVALQIALLFFLMPAKLGAVSKLFALEALMTL